MQRTRVALAGLFAAALVGLGTACSDPAAPEVPTAQPQTTPSTGASVAPSPSKRESDYDKALRYTRCMNDQGVKIDDPVIGQRLQYAEPTKAGWGPIVLTEEFEKCKKHLPATWPVKADPKDVARDRPFAECLKKQGLEVTWAEPDADGMVHYPADPNDANRPEYRAAEAACRHTIDDPAGGGR
ncbi:hypothetical protein ACFQO7_37335 [Catellatospora aurea]|uniref:Lipoprotein n=1 Tax=Catellatospora aurea TaxID=1337874 RepID=A0ABW2H847_9ACTN